MRGPGAASCALLAGPLALVLAFPANVSGEPRRAAAAEPGVQHTVQPGETLWGIARRYRVPVADLARANRIADVTRVFAGSRLVIPARPVREEVEPGTTTLPPVGAPPAQQSPADSAVDELVARAEDQLRKAYFEEALETVEAALGLLGPGEPTRAARERRSRLAVLAGTIQVALGQRDAALVSFQQALEANPALMLDPGATPPKVLTIFEAARARRDL